LFYRITIPSYYSESVLSSTFWCKRGDLAF
jgi:hypothetical protein